ncbi:hypothetical protein [Candidatus Leptofilum sp.]|uniref:hypothetical protein n=1 Tax=Candidatus Leptofilum sp. TaxID=3241576 RepID=UPI003B5CA657
MTFGDPVQIEENKYLVKLAGNETVNLFSDDIEITFVDKPDGTVVISRGPLVPDIGQLNVQSLGYARQTFGLGLDEEAIYESTHKYSILVTDIYFPDSDWGKSDAYIELVVTKND